MAKTYSQDLRDRVIEAVERGELSRRAAGRRYEVSESVAIKWLDGSREPVGHGGHRASKLMPQGKRLVDKVPQGKWQTATFLAALRNDPSMRPACSTDPSTASVSAPMSINSSRRR